MILLVKCRNTVINAITNSKEMSLNCLTISRNPKDIQFIITEDKDTQQNITSEKLGLNGLIVWASC